MTRAIPEQIVAAVTVLAESLASWCEAGRDGRLEQHEAAVLERVRQVLPTLVQAAIPWAGRIRGLPFLTVLAPSERYHLERPS
jgi:hypothetical protein